MKPNNCIILLFFICSLAKGQDTISVFKNYIIYKSDTLNRFDKNGKKTGIWLKYRTDTITESRIAKNENNITIDSLTIKKIILSATCKGNYLNGLRQNKWFLGTNDFKEIYSELIYRNDTLQSPILFYSYNLPWLKAIKVKEKWVYYIWDKDKSSYIDAPHQKFTLDFLFEMNGFSYNEFK